MLAPLQKHTDTNNVQIVILNNGKKTEKGTCAVCGGGKSKIVNAVTGGDLVRFINSVASNFKLPGQRYKSEIHYPGANFMGPGTRLDLRLNPDGSPKSDSLPINRVDEAAYRHDLMYNKYDDTPHRNQADRVMVNELNAIEDPTVKESGMRAAALPVALGKYKFGWGLKKRLHRMD